MSTELNCKIGARSDLMGADSCGSEPAGGDEFEVLVTQASLELRSVFGSSAPESASSVARLSFSSLDGVLRSESRAKSDYRRYLLHTV